MDAKQPVRNLSRRHSTSSTKDHESLSLARVAKASSELRSGLFSIELALNPTKSYSFFQFQRAIIDGVVPKVRESGLSCFYVAIRNLHGRAKQVSPACN